MTSFFGRLRRAIGPQLPRVLLDLVRPQVETTPLMLAADVVRYGALGVYLWRSRRVYGWMRGPEAVALIRACYALPGEARVVEIGSFVGCSTVLLAGARKLRGRGRVHAIDPFDASGDSFSVPIYRSILAERHGSAREQFEANLRSADVRRWVAVHVGRAEEHAAAWTDPVDMLLLDGDQSRRGVRAAYEAWSPFLRPGGLLAVHNACSHEPDHDGSRILAEEVVRAPGYRDVRWVDSLVLARKAGDG